MLLIIDLLEIDLAAGKHWIERVREDDLAKKREEIRQRHRAAWLMPPAPRPTIAGFTDTTSTGATVIAPTPRTA